jgi:hypothetical protein
MTIEVFELRMRSFRLAFPNRVAAALETTITRDIVPHAKANHPQMSEAEQRRLAALFKGGRKGSPRNPPAGARYQDRTGKTTASIRSGGVKRDGSRLIGSVHVGWAGPKQEYGTIYNAAYPFIKPAFEANRAALKERFRSAWILAARDGGL